MARIFGLLEFPDPLGKAGIEFLILVVLYHFLKNSLASYKSDKFF